MVTLNRHIPQQAQPQKSCVATGVGEFNPEEIRRLVQIGKERGLIRCTAEEPINKTAGEQATAFGSLHSRWMEIDPATAERWLAANARNRKVDEATVTAYARDMKQGVWVATHQGLAFNDRDELIDGQHRLHAIVRSGVTIRAMVTFGLPSGIEGKELTTMDCVDRGRARSVADQLRIQHGLKDGSLIAGICTCIAGLCYGKRTKKLSVAETLEIWRAYEGSITWLLQHSAKQKQLRKAGVLAGFAFAMECGAGGVSPRMVFAQLKNGAVGFEKQAIGFLHAFLYSPDVALLTRSIDRGLAELVLQALYLQGWGPPIEKLEMGLAGLEHYRRLQPERVQRIAAFFEI